MANADRNRTDEEVERLRTALDAETQRRVEIQGQLDRAGAEFGEFVSRAAHNLRESLRDVASFSQLIAETKADRLDSDARAFLALIQEGAERMQSLLAGVVDYWAMSSGDLHPLPADMEAVLCQALLYADKQITERGAIVTHGPLPAVLGDFSLLSKVLCHLIGNAVEYCDAPTPRIHISARPEGLEYIFSVRDNGPGIDPAFREAIFGPFKRLHGNEHPGNGLGLAFCKRAIEWHGGRIWVESGPETGSEFHFTLPSAR